jgi:uncharacterized cupin superfamily protein
MKRSQENSQKTSHRQSLTRLPELADEVIRKNISEELEKLKDAPTWKREAGRSSETIVKYAEFRIVLGKVRIHLPDDRREDLGPGDLLTLERCLEHDVEALEESAFLLTIAWPEVMAADHA